MSAPRGCVHSNRLEMPVWAFFLLCGPPPTSPPPPRFLETPGGRGTACLPPAEKSKLLAGEGEAWP